MRSSLSALLVFSLIFSVCAQEPTILSPLWSDEIVPALEESITILGTHVVDGDGDGYDEVMVFTSGSAATRHTSERNTVSSYAIDGELLWRYGVDDVVRNVVFEDINHDGKLEFIVSSGQVLNNFQRGSIRILDSSGDLMRSFETNGIFSGLKVEDLDSDRYYEIVGGSEGRVFLLQVYGENLWYYPPKGDGTLEREAKAVDTYDILDDGWEDILFGSDKVYVLTAEGNVLGSIDVQADIPLLKKGFKHLEVGNFLSRKYVEILAVTDDDKIICIGINSTESRMGFEAELELYKAWELDLGCKLNDVSVVDADDDEYLEILVACSDNKLYLVDNNGWVAWDYPLDGMPTDVSVEDVDFDGSEDILVCAESGSVYLMDLRGNFKWRHKSNASLQGVASGDMDADKQAEIVTVSDAGVVTAYTVNETYTLRRKADTFFNLGQEAYIVSEYDQAREYFRQAREDYLKIGYERGVEDSETFIARIENRLVVSTSEKADILYNKAQEAFFSSEYASAKAYALEAKDLYEKSADKEGEIKCELLILQVNKLLGGEVVATTLAEPTPTTLPKPTDDSGLGAYLIVGVLMLLAVLVIVLKNRSGSGGESIEESMEAPGSDLEEFDVVAEEEKNG